ncbi:hypothetical protein M405DRAFT_813652, partial [Rhizopogon salebrosus TDB-379]
MLFLSNQRPLDVLPLQEREAVTAIYGFSSSHPRRFVFQGLLTIRCFSQLSFLTGQLGQLICIDPFGILPCVLSLTRPSRCHLSMSCCSG